MVTEMNIDPTALVRELYDSDAEKYFDDPAGEVMLDPPAVCVASADDPWFMKFKDVIGDFHWTPDEALHLVAPDAKARSVICWSCPVSKVARQANRKMTDEVSRPWAYVRTFGEQVLDRMRLRLIARLTEMGYSAIGPQLAPEKQVGRIEGFGWGSSWSERHVAFVAGLGTFGLSGGLITERGVAMRLASVVTDAEIAPTPRPYGDDPFAWCLKLSQLSKNTCGKCIRRCPAGSVGQTTDQRDKEACFGQTRGATYERLKKLYGWDGSYGCGLCQTAVPCETQNPTAE